jgi:hypothetical protein
MGGVQRQGPPLLTQREGALWLATQIASRRIFAAGKLGTSETEALWFYICMRRGETKYPYVSDIKKNMTVNAGLFPATDEALDDWAQHMLGEVLETIDGLAEWNTLNPIQEGQILNAFSPKSKRFPARSLEPYYEDAAAIRWTYRIPDRTKVAVVTPFATSVGAQWSKQAAVWPTIPVWNSKVELITVKAHYSPSLSPADTWPTAVEAGGWRVAVRSMVDAVVASGAKVALIGVGALSLPLAAALKKRGVSAIHTGGATQILFGVKGRRWATHSIISTFFNDAWVSPAAEEVPSNNTAVEGGCYW